MTYLIKISEGSLSSRKNFIERDFPFDGLRVNFSKTDKVRTVLIFCRQGYTKVVRKIVGLRKNLKEFLIISLIFSK